MVPKIADFGLSKYFRAGLSFENLDEHRKLAKSLEILIFLLGIYESYCIYLVFIHQFSCRGYLAPEFYGGKITFKSDIYSLGVIIIEILTCHMKYIPKTALL